MNPLDPCKQLLRLRPFVSLELPSLARGEDRDDTVPVIWFEVFGGFDEDEAGGTEGVDGGEEAGDL